MCHREHSLVSMSVVRSSHDSGVNPAPIWTFVASFVDLRPIPKIQSPWSCQTRKLSHMRAVMPDSTRGPVQRPAAGRVDREYIRGAKIISPLIGRSRHPSEAAAGLSGAGVLEFADANPPTPAPRLEWHPRHASTSPLSREAHPGFLPGLACAGG